MAAPHISPIPFSPQGGVLEPQGVVEIKYRTPDLVTTMHRIDPTILRLKAEGGPGSTAAIKARERQLLPVYHQVAVQFAQVGGHCCLMGVTVA
jgi:acetyl-CoA carboxylase/biotin carboxylase 1